MKNIMEMGIESGFEAEAVIETQEFSNQKFHNNETCITTNSPSVVTKNEHQKSLDFSAGAGLFIVVSVFFMFFMVPVAALMSVALEIDLLPIAMTIMSSTMIAATLFLLLRAIDTSSK
jgi:nitrate reductase gamma subunit